MSKAERTTHIMKDIMENPMKINTFDLSLALGQTILVGQKKEPAEITKIEFFEKSGELVIGTTKGPRKALTFSIPAGTREEELMCPADKYR